MDLIRYNARLGKGLASIHRHYPQLWTDQSKRVSIADYAVFDLTRYKFKIFFSKLATWEKAIFILTRLLSIVSMYEGFYMYRYTPEQAVWNPIKSTKIAFSESSS
jgi:hypothetical protein